MIAHVRIDDDGPLMTSEDLEGTARVYRLLPHIVEHACLGDAGETFRDAMGDTELAHLLEHVTVELLAQTDLAGDMPAGRTWVDEVDDRTYQIELACPDDVLVAAALSCGVWILDWAYKGGGDPEPDVNAIVKGLVKLVRNVGDEGEDLVIDYGDEELADEEFADEDAYLEDEPAEDGESAADELDEEPVAPAPLWTEAPETPAEREEERGRSMEAEIDEIMATFETTPLSEDDAYEA